MSAYDPQYFEQWISKEDHFQIYEKALQDYIQCYSHLFRTKSQKKYFQIWIRGLFSSLERKSIEPIALHFLGKREVRSMQQFFSRAPLQEQEIMDFYQKLLAEQLNVSYGMLFVENNSFVKKGSYSVGVKRQYCECLKKRENCQIGVFLAYAGENGYGLVDRELYLPQEWFWSSYQVQRKKCHLPLEKTFVTKSQIALNMLNNVLKRKLFPLKWIGCDASYGSSYEFLDGLILPEGIWYFAEVYADEQVFLEYPQMYLSQKNGDNQRNFSILTNSFVCVKEIAEEQKILWERIGSAEGEKESVVMKRKVLRCFRYRKNRTFSYIKRDGACWLYLCQYKDGTNRYFVSNAPKETRIEELDRAADFRWSVKQCMEECKSYLGMGDYECRSYSGWKRHMQFVMIAHLFTNQLKEMIG